MAREKRPFLQDWNRRESNNLPPEKLRDILGQIYLPDDADRLFSKLMKGDDSAENNLENGD